MHTIPVARGTSIRAELAQFHGKWRVDIRQYYEFSIGDPDSARPTKRGVNLSVRDLPALRAALQALEAAALARSALEAEDYEQAGLDVPAEL